MSPGWLTEHPPQCPQGDSNPYPRLERPVTCAISAMGAGYYVTLAGCDPASPT